MVDETKLESQNIKEEENKSQTSQVVDESSIWDDFDEDYTQEERQKLENLYESTLQIIEEQEIVTGIVMTITDKEVVINIGFKSEGIIPINEFRHFDDLKIGDEIEVFVESVEDKKGQLIVSHKRARTLKSWRRVNKALETGEVIQGLIKRRTKGGFVVDVDGVEAFLPGSQIDIKPIRDYDIYVGQNMEFKVVKINPRQNNVVVSHKVLIEKDLEKQREEILQNLERGQILEGMVKNITNFGVFIDLGGVDGLLHITDITWGRINHPEEVLELDQKINIVVLDFDEDKKRISLGLKQLEPHPWEALPEDVQVGSKVKGTVVTVADYGVFIEVMPGIEGLIHVSEMSWSQHLKNPTELYKVGDEIEAVVISLERDERKMSLSLKQGMQDPWEEAALKYAIGIKHTGIVRNITAYGLFVELEEGIDGLIHVSDLSWTKKINHPADFVQKDQSLEVVVLDIDVEGRRLSLGHKQLTEDPWDTFETIFAIGSEHTGNIKEISKDGAIVEMEYGIEAFAPKSHLKVEEGNEELKVGEVVKVVVIDFQREAKKILVSHTRTWKKDTKKKSGGKANTPEAKPDTLGDIEALATLKKDLDDAKDE